MTSAADASVASSGRLDRKTIMALVAMGIAVLVVANDFTALSVALPPIEKQFDTDVATVQWVINAYALSFGVLIVAGGRIADMFGRRRAFVTGALIFAGFSVLGGAAQSTAWLIACRALMGIGGALMWPAILAMTYAILPEDKAGLAGGLIIGAAGIGNALGPMFGGALTALSWRWVFFVNLPVALAAVAVTLRAIKPDAAESAEHGIDYAGVLTLSLGLIALLIALDQVTDWGWGDPRIIGLIVVFVVLLAAFAWVERRQGERALVPRDVLGNHDFSAACLVVLLMSTIFFATLLYLPQFMQKILGYSPLRSGAGLLPMMGMFALTSFVAGPLYTRLGAKLIVTLGAAAIAIGVFLLSLIATSADYADLVIGMLILGVGVGLFYSSITTAGVTALAAGRAALAGGIVYMCQIAGGSIGLGLNTTVFSARSDSTLDTHIAALGTKVTDQQADLAHGILAGTKSAQTVFAQLEPSVAHRLEASVRDAFVAGLHSAFRMDAALALAGFFVAVMFVGGAAKPEVLQELRRWHHRAVPRGSASGG